MARIATLARRSFLIGAGALTAGLAVGTYLVRREPANPLQGGLDGEGRLPPDAATLNPYVLIDASGVTLITPRADLGQGAHSVLAALIAEELDLAWGQFKVAHGPPSAAYYNGKVAVEGFPIAATSDSFFARGGRLAGDVVAKVIGLQLTGGSSTVPDAFDKLRVAGAVARQMLLAAAAAQSGVPVDQLKTRDGLVLLPDGRSLGYTSLAGAAGQLSPPSSVALKPAAQWRLLGQPMQRLDTVAKSTGAAAYGIDLRLPGMVYATVRASPRRGGLLLRVDDSAARAAKGVIKLVPLADGVGVIADNTWRAFQAAALLRPEWGAATHAASTEALFQQVGESFTNERQDSRLKDDGDVDAALQGAAAPAHATSAAANAAASAAASASPSVAGGQRLQAEYRVPFLAHAALEPLNAVVQLKDGRLDIWTGTQIPRFVVAAAAQLTGLPEQAIHLHVQISGGSFGRRLEDDYVRQAIALAQAHPGVPIKMTWPREEDMTHDFPRPLAIGRGRGVVGGGQVQALALDIATPSVTASQLGRLGQPAAGPDMAIVAGAWDQPWAIPHYRVTGYRVPPMVPVSSWRSVGASINGFLHESFFDELVHAAGADPLAERLRLCSHAPSRRVLEAVGELAGWAKPLAPSPDGKRGRGLAFTLSFGVPVAEVVEVTATAKGIRIDRVFVAVEVGRVLDPVNFEAQVQGGVIWGLGHAMQAELTYADGQVEQTNFHAYGSLRLDQTPSIVVRALETTAEVRGIGEPGVPPAAPALANAIFNATGQRIRELPLRKQVDFV